MKKTLISQLIILSLGSHYGFRAQTKTRAVAPAVVLIKAGRLLDLSVFAS